MDQHQIELYQKRGLLLERISAERNALARQMAPVRLVLGTADRAFSLAHEGALFVRRHPAGVAAVVALTVALRPRVVWRWVQRGFFVWRSWRAVRNLLPGWKQ